MGGAALTLRTESSLPLVTGEMAVRENRQFRPGQPVSQSLLRKHQKCKSPLNSGLCGDSAVSLWGESLTRRLYGGEGGIRTLDTLPYTHFPGVLLRPLGHLSKDLNSLLPIQSPCSIWSGALMRARYSSAARPHPFGAAVAMLRRSFSAAPQVNHSDTSPDTSNPIFTSNFP